MHVIYMSFWKFSLASSSFPKSKDARSLQADVLVVIGEGKNICRQTSKLEIRPIA